MKKADKALALVTNIIKENQYLSLGTVGDNGMPWVAPVAYAYDKRHNLYFMSLPSSTHIKSITKKPEVSGAIFNSQQAFGEGRGVQFEGKVIQLPKSKAAAVFKLYFGRNWPYGTLTNLREFRRFFRLYKYRFYKIELASVWVTDVSKDYDARVKIDF